MIVKIFLINACVDGLFSGGQALVVILRRRSPDHLLQALAWELKAPVTAYVLPYAEGFAVRYFSASGELKSGGYAALAAAKALYFTGLAPPDQPLSLEGLSGPVRVQPSAGLEGGVSLVVPPIPVAPTPPDWAKDLPTDLNQAKVLNLQDVGTHRLICLAEQPEQTMARAVASKLGFPPNRVVFTWPHKAGYALRYFGAAGEEAQLPLDLDFHAALAPFWGKRLGLNRLDIHHLAHRQALLRAELTAEAVELSGQMQIVYKAAPAMGELTGEPSMGERF
jgi:predicted PhzF superfamily epimerase YddE/YHI9